MHIHSLRQHKYYTDNINHFLQQNIAVNTQPRQSTDYKGQTLLNSYKEYKINI
jgi:hypothetical protein